MRHSYRSRGKRSHAPSARIELFAEALEARYMLAALPGPDGAPDASVPPGTLLVKPAAPAGFDGKLDSQLWGAVQNLNQPITNAAIPAGRMNSAGDVQVDIQLSGQADSVVSALNNLGIQIGSRDDEVGIIEAWVKPALLGKIAAMSAVSSIGVPDYAIADGSSVDSAGDSLLNADKVRGQFAAYGIDGTGVKVGVISDGADDISAVSDLPAVTIDPNHPGSGDEGVAMLEIVHDLAPGAQLYFSGPQTSLDMADSISYLVGQGCKVIVDDLTFPGEPYFEDDGIVESAAQNAVNQGVVYVTAAGNAGTPSGFFGNSHYQGMFVDDGSGNQNFLGTAGVDDTKNMLVLGGSTLEVSLEWSDQWGRAADDYDLYLYDSTMGKVLATSALTQNGSGNPLEILAWTNPSVIQSQTVKIVIHKFSGAARELEMFTFGGGTGAFEYNTPGDSLISQEAAPGVIAVGAIDANSPGASTIESFSSQGPSTIFTNFATQTSITRNTLDGAAIDDVQTEIGQLGDFENPFFGTSAAAPHAAAIAALLLQINPSLNPTQVDQIMQDTAVDLTAYGVGYDQVSGAGRFNALDAAYQAFTPSAPALAAASDSGISQSDDLTNIKTPTITGTAPANSFVTVYVDGIANQSVQLGAGLTTYSIATSPLSDGAHTITIRMASSSTVPAANYSNPSNTLQITIDTLAPHVTAASYNFDDNPPDITFHFTEPLANGISAASVVLHDLDTNTNLTNFAASLDASHKLLTITFPGMPTGLPDGDYTATLSSALTDAAGNALISGPLTFFVLTGDVNHDGVVNAADFAIVAANYGLSPATFSQGDLNYDGKVDAGDFDILASRFNEVLGESFASPSLPAEDLFGSHPVTGMIANSGNDESILSA